MRLRLIASTPDIEALIAAAILTTTGRRPSEAYEALKRGPRRAGRIVERLEFHHGSVFEHNRLCWLLEAEAEEILELLLRSRFLQFSRIGEGRWLMSANLRTVIEYVRRHRDPMAEHLLESIREVAP
ncbi:hypothetical protein DRO24_06005, partial [Candidatus Bathyarchaeota archaeon]